MFFFSNGICRGRIEVKTSFEVFSAYCALAVQSLKEEDYRCHSALDEHKDHRTWHQLNISLFLFVLSTSPNCAIAI